MPWPKDPTAPSEAGHIMSLCIDAVMGHQGAIHGVSELACTMNFNQTSGICVVQEGD